MLTFFRLSVKPFSVPRNISLITGVAKKNTLILDVPTLIFRNVILGGIYWTKFECISS